MKKFIPVFILTFCLAGVIQNVAAQESLNSSGSDINNVDGSISYSVGQAFWHEYSDGGSTINEGVQHAFEIFIFTESISVKSEDVAISIFPNPTSEYLMIEINQDFEQISANLLDENGRVIQVISLTDSITKIDMSGLSAAVYFISVYDSNSSVANYKVIKK
jgi:hypothetical protein